MFLSVIGLKWPTLLDTKSSRISPIVFEGFICLRTNWEILQTIPWYYIIFTDFPPSVWWMYIFANQLRDFTNHYLVIHCFHGFFPHVWRIYIFTNQLTDFENQYMIIYYFHGFSQQCWKDLYICQPIQRFFKQYFHKFM